jgi:O-antigen/teichoic acid export membrane protein
MKAMKILLLSIIPIALTNCFGPVLLANKDVKWYNSIFLFVVIFLLIMNGIFLQKYELLASATISLSSWSIVLILMIFFSIKSQQISIEDVFNYKSILSIILISASIYGIYQFIEAHFLLKGIISGMISLIIGYLLVREELQLIKK